MVRRLPPSRSMRSMEPSFWLGTPMSVQYKWPAAASMTMPSGWRQFSTSSLRSLPSGLTVRMRLPLRSSTYSRPSAAGVGWFMAILVGGEGGSGRAAREIGRAVLGEGGARQGDGQYVLAQVLQDVDAHLGPWRSEEHTSE